MIKNYTNYNGVNTFLPQKLKAEKLRRILEKFHISNDCGRIVDFCLGIAFNFATKSQDGFKDISPV